MNSLEIRNALTYLAENDNVLAKIIASVGKCNLKPKRNYYKALLRAIIGQQLSIYAAEKISNKFMKYYNFHPSPEKILNTPDSVLKSLGLSRGKSIYVKDFSAKILGNEISLKNISKKNDFDIINELTTVKGIGTWTAHMFLIFTLGRINVLPTNDLGLRKAIMLNYKLKKLPDEKTILKIAKRNRWSPYCTLASWYLWRSLEL